MANQRYELTAFLGIMTLTSILWLEGCMPSRPSNVPADSVYIVGADVGWWQRCSYDPKEDVDYCQIYNLGGRVLFDEVFLPYDGGKAAKEDELKIVSRSNLTGPYYVCLENGRILIPKSDFENQKRFIDWRLSRHGDPHIIQPHK
jgi:hypothetical protein